MGPDYSTGVDSQNESSPCMWSQAALALRLCGITKLLWQIHLDFRCFFIDLHWSWRVVFSISANVLLSCQSADLHPRSLPANWACPANQKMPGHLGFSDRVLLGDTGKEPTYSKPKTEVTFHRKPNWCVSMNHHLPAHVPWWYAHGKVYSGAEQSYWPYVPRFLEMSKKGCVA